MLSIKRAGLSEAEQLHRIQKEAFQDDLAAYQDFETNPACESVQRMEEKIQAHDYYAIYFGDEIIGGVGIQRKADQEYSVNKLLDERPIIIFKSEGILIF